MQVGNSFSLFKKAVDEICEISKGKLSKFTALSNLVIGERDRWQNIQQQLSQPNHASIQQKDSPYHQIHRLYKALRQNFHVEPDVGDKLKQLPELLKQLNFDPRLTYRMEGTTVRLAKKAIETSTDEFRGLLKKILHEQPEAEQFILGCHTYSRNSIEQGFDCIVPSELVETATVQVLKGTATYPKFMIRVLFRIDEDTHVHNQLKVLPVSETQLRVALKTLFEYLVPCTADVYLFHDLLTRSSFPRLPSNNYFQNHEYGKVITINKERLEGDDNLIFRKDLLEACPQASHVALELKNGTLSYTREAFAALIDEYEKEPEKKREFHLKLPDGKVYPVSFEFYQEVLTVLSKREFEGIHNGSQSNPLDLIMDDMSSNELMDVFHAAVHWHSTGIFPRFDIPARYHNLAVFLEMYSTDSRWSEQAMAHLRCLPSVDLPSLKGHTWESLLEFLKPYESAEEICVGENLRYSRKLIESLAANQAFPIEYLAEPHTTKIYRSQHYATVVTFDFLCRFWPQLGNVKKIPDVNIGSKKHPLHIDFEEDLFFILNMFYLVDKLDEWPTEWPTVKLMPKVLTYLQAHAPSDPLTNRIRTIIQHAPRVELSLDASNSQTWWESVASQLDALPLCTRVRFPNGQEWDKAELEALIQKQQRDFSAVGEGLYSRAISHNHLTSKPLLRRMIRPDKLNEIEESKEARLPENLGKILEITSYSRHHTDSKYNSDQCVGWIKACTNVVEMIAAFCREWATPDVAEQLEMEEIVPRLKYLRLTNIEWMTLYSKLETPAARTYVEKIYSDSLRSESGEFSSAIQDPLLLATLGIINSLHFQNLTLTQKTYPRFKQFLIDYLKSPIRALDLSGIKLPRGVSISDLLSLCDGLESLTLGSYDLDSMEDLSLIKNVRELTLLGLNGVSNEHVSFPVLPRLEKLHLKNWSAFPDCNALPRLRELYYTGVGTIPIPALVGLRTLEVIAFTNKTIQLSCEKDTFSAPHMRTLRLVGCVTDSNHLSVTHATNLNILTLQRSDVKVTLPDSHLVQRLSLVDTTTNPEMGYKNVDSLFLSSASDKKILGRVPRLKALKVYLTSAAPWNLRDLPRLERVTFQSIAGAAIHLTNLPNLWRANIIKLPKAEVKQTVANCPLLPKNLRVSDIKYNSLRSKTLNRLKAPVMPRSTQEKTTSVWWTFLKIGVAVAGLAIGAAGIVFLARKHFRPKG